MTKINQDLELNSVTRPPLRIFGGGWLRAKWTESFFPPHENYVEPCFGSGSILFNKPLSKLETVNDIDGRIVNYFEILRSKPESLIDLIRLTPWAEAEFYKCLQLSEDKLEDARRFFFSCWAGIKGGPNPGPTDFRWQKKTTRRGAAVRDIVGLDHLHAAAERLKNVQILNRDALEIIDKFIKEDCLIYFDPPYLHSLRTNRKGYRYEVTDQWHCDAARLLQIAQGAVIVAGYPSELYRELFENRGWHRVEHHTRTNSGGRATDALWLSPITQERLAQNG